MSTIGRNDPCPCGSGKKYKKCCGAANVDTSDSIYTRIRRLDGESANLLLKFAKQTCGEDALEDAWEEFHFSDGTPFDTSDPEFDFFLRWLTFNWKPYEEESLAEMFLSAKGAKVENDMCRFIEATRHAPYSFLQTLDVDPGVGVKMRDVLRKRDFQVMERTGSTLLERGYIVFARVVEWEGVTFLMGIGAQPFRPAFLGRLLDLRTFLESKAPMIDGSIATETLLKAEDNLRDLYFELAYNEKNRRIAIRNTDGDPLALHALTYDVPSFEEAFHALKDLEQKATRMDDAALLEEAEMNEAGQPSCVHIHWLKKRKTSTGHDVITLAALTIRDSTLVVEVNSEKRSRRIQKEIAKRLGDRAVLLKTEITSSEGIMKKAAETAVDQDEESEHDRIMRESPEARRLMKQMMDRHWAAWPDTPLPALRGMTPRLAANDPQGRELLESLLMEFDLQNPSKKDEFLRVDTAKLRLDLGLEKT